MHLLFAYSIDELTGVIICPALPNPSIQGRCVGLRDGRRSVGRSLAPNRQRRARRVFRVVVARIHLRGRVPSAWVNVAGQACREWDGYGCTGIVCVCVCVVCYKCHLTHRAHLLHKTQCNSTGPSQRKFYSPTWPGVLSCERRARHRREGDVCGI